MSRVISIFVMGRDVLLVAGVSDGEVPAVPARCVIMPGGPVGCHHRSAASGHDGHGAIRRCHDAGCTGGTPEPGSVGSQKVRIRKHGDGRRGRAVHAVAEAR